MKEHITAAKRDNLLLSGYFLFKYQLCNIIK